MAEQTEQLLEQVRQLLHSGDAAALRRCLIDSPRADLAEVMELLDDEEQHLVMVSLDVTSAGEVLSLLDEATRGEVVEDLSQRHLTDLVATLPPDDAADVLGELPPDESEHVLDQMPAEQSRQLENLMRYPPDTAGGLMTPVLVALPQTATVSQAVVSLRESSIEDELFNVYVVDDQNRLKGIVPLRRLVTAPPQTPISQVTLRRVISIRDDQDQEEVANTFGKYDLAAVPVVDASGRLLGRITYDDVMDVAEEEAQEDLLLMAGTDHRELEDASPIHAARVRGGWLIACMIGTLVTVAVAAFFKDHLLPVEIFAVLVIFGPSIAAMSGNSGVQASTLTIRGLATGSLAGRSLKRVYLRQVRIHCALALVFGILGGGIAALLMPLLERLGRTGPELSPLLVGCSVGGAMLLAILYATTLGIILPFALRRLRVDPAIASGPLVTTLNDSMSWAIYLLLATLLLRMGC